MKTRFAVLGFAVASLLVSCDGNLYESVASKDSDKYYLVEAEQQIYRGLYDRAEESLAKVKNKGSKEYVKLDVSMTLGKASFSLWDLLIEIVDTLTDSKTSKGGIDAIFNTLSDSIFGVDDERASRLFALTSSASKLKNLADKDDQTEGLRCVLTGIYVLPTVYDGIKSLESAVTSLSTLQDNIIGNGATAEQCPGLDAFESSISTINTVQKGFSFVLAETSSCPLLNFLNEGTASLNDVQARLSKFIKAADKGCNVSLCSATNKDIENACKALDLGCVSTMLEDETAIAGDGKINQCELIINCMSGGCFDS